MGHTTAVGLIVSSGSVGLREAGQVCAGSTEVLKVGVAARTVISVEIFGLC